MVLKLTKPTLYFSFTLTLYLFLITSINARELLVQQLPKQSNNPSQFITQIEPLKNGYLLFGTKKGARLFDGYQFIPLLPSVGHSISPLNSHIYDTLEDSRGNIWLATAMGLYWLENGSKILSKMSHQKGNSQSLINDHVRSILEDSNGDLWFATLNGITYLNIKTQTFKHFTSQPANDKNNLYIGNIFSLIEEPNKAIWVVSTTGLYVINLKTKIMTKIKASVGDIYMTSAALINNNEIWFGSDKNGIYVYNLTTEKFSNINQKNNHQYQLKSNSVWSIFQDSSGLIWVGYWTDGVSIYNPKTEEMYSLDYRVNNSNYLPSSSVEMITEDSNGLIWLATTYGAAFFNVDSFNLQQLSHNPSDNKSISNSHVLSIIEDEDGIAWLGTGKGLERWNPTSNVLEHYYDVSQYSNPDTNNAIWAIDFVDRDNLLLATNKGMKLFNISTKTETLINYIKDRYGEKLESVFYTLNNKGDGNFYASSSEAIIYELNPFTGESKIIFDPIQDPITIEIEYFNAVLYAKDKTFWLGTTTGLYHFNPKTKAIEFFNTQTDKHSLSDNIILSIKQDHLNNLWVGTSNGGINKITFKNNNVSRISTMTMKQGLPSNTISNMLIDKDIIWFTSDKEFGHFNINMKEIKTFSLMNDSGNEIAENSIYKGRSGYVYIGGGRVYRISLDSFNDKVIMPNIRFSGVSINYEEHEYYYPLMDDQIIKLYPNDTVVTFSFSNLDYSESARHIFRYQLKGFDKKWLKPGTGHTASYTQLPSGSYEFLVQGRNKLGGWHGEIKKLSVIVYPPYWKSTLAYWVYLIIVTMIITLLIKRVKKTRSEELKTISIIKKSEERLRNVLWGSGDSLWNWELNSNKIFYSDGFQQEEFGIENVVDSDEFFKGIYSEDKDLLMEVINKNLQGESEYFEIQYRVLSSKNKQQHWLLTKGRVIDRDHNGKALLLAGTSRNIDSLKKAEKALKYLANYDQLTNLPNRSLFHEQLSHAISIAERFNEHTALLFFDLDGFKLINDSLGHSVGDQLLIAVSERIKGLLRAGDSLSRLGGDEFAIIMERVTSASEIVPTLERIQQQLVKPFELKNQSVVSSVSIGIALCPQDADTAEDLLKQADIAMYEAKRGGKKKYCFYDPDMNALLVKRIAIEHEMEIAIKESQFKTFYQPKVSVSSNEVVGFEALLRWIHPKKGIISPADFIPIAEETGQILDLGNWVLHDACQQVAQWNRKGWKGCIAINIAALQFHQSDLVENVSRVINETKIPPELIELEITEGTLIKNIEHTRDVILRLKQLGVRISLDDFGTGFSSLSYLQQLPIDILKIDRSFVNEITRSKKSAKLSVAIINMAHSLDLVIVAEGIEEQDQLDFLKQAGCEEYQGYLFSKPIPADEVYKKYIVKD